MGRDSPEYKVTHDDIIRNLQEHADELRKERDEIVAESEEEIATLKAKVAELEDEVEALGLGNSKLADTLDEAEYDLADAEGLVTDLKKQIAPYESLADALAIYLSWMDSPPPGMNPDRHAEIARNFRRDVDTALRAAR